jgi:hypothetical protein
MSELIESCHENLCIFMLYAPEYICCTYIHVHAHTHARMLDSFWITSNYKQFPNTSSTIRTEPALAGKYIGLQVNIICGHLLIYSYVFGFPETKI